ncbi:hypothetical protein ACFY1P_11185 [Streptomyces sp. NPDC001407]
MSGDERQPQQPCQHCEGKGLIAQPDGSVVVCPEANGPGHY